MTSLTDQLKYSFIYELIYPVVFRYEVIKWLQRGKTPPTPHLIKERLVRGYAKKYNINIFVETGTYLGVMVDSVKRFFREVYTIELDGKLYERAKNKFRKESNVSVLLGDSAKVLPRVVNKINEPALFWLDAHYSKGITAKGRVVTPIKKELSLILKQKSANHIILVDDANLFSGKSGYPSIEETKKLILDISEKSSFKIEENIIVIK